MTRRSWDAYTVVERIALMSEFVRLDVGGHLFSTTRSTLTSVPGSMFSFWFSRADDASEDRGMLMAAREDGSYFIDRPGEPFVFILDYLRCGLSHCVLPGIGTPNVSILLKQLIREADFYGLSELAEAARIHYDSPLAGVARFVEDSLIVLSVGGTRFETTRETLSSAPRLLAFILEKAPQSAEADATGALRVVYHIDEDALVVSAVLRFARYGSQGSGRGSFNVAHGAAKDKQSAAAAATLAQKWGMKNVWENAFGEVA